MNESKSIIYHVELSSSSALCILSSLNWQHRKNSTVLSVTKLKIFPKTFFMDKSDSYFSVNPIGLEVPL